MSETQLKKKVMAYMRERGIFCFKVAGGPRQAAGISDIIASIPPDGWFLAMELKAPDAKCEPSELQEKFLEKVAHTGGMAVCVNSFEGARDLIDAMLAVSERTKELVHAA